jgi:hypothetical protein
MSPPRLILAVMAPADEASDSADEADASVSNRSAIEAESVQGMPSEVERAPRAESINVLLEMVQRIVDDERVRGAVLESKATTFAGFSGTILSIVAALGREIFKADLGIVGNPTVRVLFVVSIVALATAVTLAIGGVLRTQLRLLVSSEQVIAFASPPWIYTDAVDIERDMLTSLGLTLDKERRLNDRRARLTNRAALALLVGLLTVAAQALVFSLDELVY